jgi:hypothetical protein
MLLLLMLLLLLLLMVVVMMAGSTAVPGCGVRTHDGGMMFEEEVGRRCAF